MPTRDPILRTASPYADPSVKGPKSQILADGYQTDTRKSEPTVLLLSQAEHSLTYSPASDRQHRQCQ